MTGMGWVRAEPMSDHAASPPPNKAINSRRLIELHSTPVRGDTPIRKANYDTTPHPFM